MQRLDLAPDVVRHDPTTVLVLGEHAALTVARTAGVPLFDRCPPVHSVIVGRSRVAVAGRVSTQPILAIPAGTPHRVLELADPHAAVAYLDPRRHRFDDVQRLAAAWRGFVPGRDDLREAFGDTLAVPRHSVDRRVLRALEVIEAEACEVATAASRVGLSSSRLTHRVTEALGSPPRTWGAWFKLQRAIARTVLFGDTLTDAAHHAGFADSAHLTRTCKHLMGVRPAKMLPQIVYLAPRG
jgi:AraC-like DNA-binding protein